VTFTLDLAGEAVFGAAGTEVAGTSVTWSIASAEVPHGLSPDRAWCWCILSTLRDMRLSARRGRPISLFNAERLFCRRWARVSMEIIYEEREVQMKVWIRTDRIFIRRIFIR